MHELTNQILYLQPPNLCHQMPHPNFLNRSQTSNTQHLGRCGLGLTLRQGKGAPCASARHVVLGPPRDVCYSQETWQICNVFKNKFISRLKGG